MFNKLMAISRELEPVEDWWLEQTESTGGECMLKAGVNGDHSKVIHVGCCSAGCTVQAAGISRNIS